MISLEMKINTRATGRPKMTRPIRLSISEPDRPTSATRTAERMVAACRENVRFLNRHLKRFEKYLELPPVIDNVLYLAYTLKICNDAPFETRELRMWLAGAGIETRPKFSFMADLQATYCSPATDRMDLFPKDKYDSVFCGPCHYHLSILDLQHMVETFESFFWSIKSREDLN
jgi:dTDP-4-amino-4,6-dideoxygalactose transaminase